MQRREADRVFTKRCQQRGGLSDTEGRGEGGSLTTGAQTCQQLAFRWPPLTQPTRGCPHTHNALSWSDPLPCTQGHPPIPLPAQLPPGFFPPNRHMILN